MTTTNSINSALIVEGGALRSSFSAGILDRFIERSFYPFDLTVGVSAGAANLLYYRAGCNGYLLDLYRKFSNDKQFLNWWRFLRGGHLLDLDWLIDTLSSQLPDTRLAFDHPSPFIVVTTEVASGNPCYLTANSHNLIDLLKASMSLPLIYRGFPLVNGVAMTDGGVADGIPVNYALEQGAQRIMIIRSRPVNYYKKDTPGHRLIRLTLRKHHALVKKMQQRTELHEQVKKLIKNPPAGVQLVDLSPPESFRMQRFSRDTDTITKGYELGFACADKAIDHWQTLTKVNHTSDDRQGLDDRQTIHLQCHQR